MIPKGVTRVRPLLRLLRVRQAASVLQLPNLLLFRTWTDQPRPCTHRVPAHARLGLFDDSHHHPSALRPRAHIPPPRRRQRIRHPAGSPAPALEDPRRPLRPAREYRLHHQERRAPATQSRRGLQTRLRQDVPPVQGAGSQERWMETMAVEGSGNEYAQTDPEYFCRTVCIRDLPEKVCE